MLFHQPKNHSMIKKFPRNPLTTLHEEKKWVVVIVNSLIIFRFPSPQPQNNISSGRRQNKNKVKCGERTHIFSCDERLKKWQCLSSLFFVCFSYPYFYFEALEENPDVLMFLVFHQCFTSVSTVFHQCLTSVSPVFRQCFINVSPMFRQCFASLLPVFYQCFTCASSVFHQWYLRVSLVFPSVFRQWRFVTATFLRICSYFYLCLTSVSPLFQNWIKNVTKMFQMCFKVVSMHWSPCSYPSIRRACSKMRAVGTSAIWKCIF